MVMFLEDGVKSFFEIYEGLWIDRLLKLFREILGNMIFFLISYLIMFI